MTTFPSNIPREVRMRSRSGPRLFPQACSCDMEGSEAAWMWHLGTGLRGGLGSAGGAFGHGDLRGLFQRAGFCDSVTPWCPSDKDGAFVPPGGHRRCWRCPAEKPALSSGNSWCWKTQNLLFLLTGTQGHKVALPLHLAPVHGPSDPTWAGSAPPQ